MNDIKALIDRCLTEAQTLHMVELATMAKKAQKELAEIKRTNYAFLLYAHVTIQTDGVPVISKDDEEEAYDSLDLLFESDWMKDSAEPRYNEFLQNVTELDLFKEIKEPGVYRFFQVGKMTPETSTDWETGITDLDGFIYEPLNTTKELMYGVKKPRRMIMPEPTIKEIAEDVLNYTNDLEDHDFVRVLARMTIAREDLNSSLKDEVMRAINVLRVERGKGNAAAYAFDILCEAMKAAGFELVLLPHSETPWSDQLRKQMKGE